MLDQICPFHLVYRLIPHATLCRKHFTCLKKTPRISRGPAPKSVSHEQSTIADLCMNNLFRNQIGVLGLSFIHRGTQKIYIYLKVRFSNILPNIDSSETGLLL